MTIQPCHNKVLIERIQEASRTIETPGHILLDADKDPDVKMIVVAFGPQVTCVAIGDVILPRPNTNFLELSKELTNGRAMALVDDSAIYAVIK
jgi:co-chaperonin GroES (HSP10)